MSDERSNDWAAPVDSAGGDWGEEGDVEGGYDPTPAPRRELSVHVDWSPAAGGGTNFKTHKLVEVDAQRVGFQATAGARLFSLIFFASGAFVTFGMSGIFGAQGDSFTLLFTVPFGLIFMAVGAWMWRGYGRPILFDRRAGYFWVGRGDPTDPTARASMKHAVELERIHALQLLSERVSGSDSSYTSYELNLVLDDGDRLNVVDHGNLLALRADAERLAAFLNVELLERA